jgi:predicted metalloprotease
VDFDDDAPLDTSQVQDARGGGGSGRGGGGIGLPGLALGGGGGIVGIVVLVLVLLTSGGGGGPTSGDPFAGGGSRTGSVTAPSSALAQRCRRGADADRDEDCRVVAVVNSVQTFWASTFRAGNRPYSRSDTRLFTGSTSTGCGSATSDVGPFYCPADTTVYIDLGFFDELRTTYGAQGGDFAQAYVLAHEYGHHVQDLLGTSERAQASGVQEGPQGSSVRLELQADCYAGVWAANAQHDGFVRFDSTDVSEGLSAAAAVGDDRIQSKATGRVDPESWTHGSAQQRTTWFRTGLSSGSPAACDTFGASRL